MPDNPQYLLELIDQAQAIAEKERRPMAALYLNMAADAAAEMKTNGADAKPIRRRRKWRWTPSRGLNA
jgi:hypothetical protein